MIDIYINGQLADISGESVAITFVNVDIADISTRASTYIDKITLPATPKNTAIFDGLGVIGNTSNAPYVELITTIVIDGLEVIRDGVGYLYERNEEGFVFNLYDGIKNIAEALGNKSIKDLNYTNGVIGGIQGAGLNHRVTLSNISQYLSTTSGVIYTPDVVYVDATLTKRTLSVMPPNVYWSTVWGEIFRQNGLEYVCDYLSEEQVRRAVIGSSSGVSPSDAPAQVFIAGGQSTATQWLRIPNTVFYEYYFPNSTYLFSLMNSASVTQCAMSVGNSVCSMANIYNAGASSLPNDIYTIQVSFARFVYRYGADPISGFYLQLYVNNTLVKELDYTNEIGTLVTLEFTNFDFFDVILSSTDTFRIGARVVTGAFSGTQWRDRVPISFDIDYLKIFKRNAGVDIDFSELLGEYTQASFVKDGMKMFGLVSYRRKDGVFVFKRLQDILGDRGGALDISDNILFDATAQNENYSPSYGDTLAQKNYIKYQYEDLGDAAKTLPADFSQNRDGFFAITNRNIPAETTFSTSIFNVNRPNISPQISPAERLFPFFQNLYEQDLTTKNTGAKIFHVAPQSGTIALKFNTGDATSGSIGYTGTFYGATDSLANGIKGQDLINTNYSSLKNVLDRFKKLTVSAYFTPLDLYGLDFSRLVYLSQTGRYYLLYKIKNYVVVPFKGKKVNTGGELEIELIELPT